MPAHLAIYAAGKAAVVALTEAIREQLAKERIGITVLCPGPVKSNIHELAKNRPERFVVNAGFQAAAHRLGQRMPSKLWMEPTEVGVRVLSAIRDDALYVITHGEWRPDVVARHEAILAAMPEKVNPDLIATLRPPDPKS